MAAEVWFRLDEVSKTGSKLRVTPVLNGKELRTRTLQVDLDMLQGVTEKDVLAAVPFLLKQMSVGKTRVRAKGNVDSKQYVLTAQTKVS